jgi:hypothetical protein
MEISVMPWAQLKKPITLGPVEFSPGSEFLSEGNLSKEDSDLLGRYLSSFYARGQVVEPITICSVNKRASDFTDDDWELIISAAATLVFATVCPVTVAAVKTDNRSRVPASSDRFLLHRAFLAKEGVVQLKGDMTNLEPYATLVEHKPRYIIDGLMAPQESCVEDLDYLFQRAPTETTAKRLLRALFFFARAQTNNPEVTEFAKLVFLGTAFEIIFDCQGKREKRLHVMNEMESLWSLDLTREPVTYSSQSTQRVSPAAWYQSFYMVRNAYVHGSVEKQVSCMNYLRL